MNSEPLFILHLAAVSQFCPLHRRTLPAFFCGSSSGVQQNRVVLVLAPASGIAEDAFPDTPEVDLAANDVLVVVALPQSPLKRRPSSLSDTHDIFMGCHGFEGLYYLYQRPRHRPAGANTRFAPTVDHNDAMDMIWHHHECVQFHSGKPARQSFPDRPQHPSGIIQPHLSAIHTSHNAHSQFRVQIITKYAPCMASIASPVPSASYRH